MYRVIYHVIGKELKKANKLSFANISHNKYYCTMVNKQLVNLNLLLGGTDYT